MLLIYLVSLSSLAAGSTASSAGQMDNYIKLMQLDHIWLNFVVSSKEDNFNAGVKDMINSDYTAAINHFSISIDKKPYRKAYEFRGMAYQLTGEAGQALQDYSQSLKLKKNYKVYYNRGLIYMELGEIEKAIKDLDQSIEMLANVKALNNRAVALVIIGRTADAMTDLNQAIKKNENYWLGINNRGLLHEANGEFQLARRDYKRALEIEPDYQPAKKNLFALDFYLNE